MTGSDIRAGIQALYAVLDVRQSALNARREARRAMPPGERARDAARRAILSRAALSPATRGQLRQACSDHRYAGQISAADVFADVFDELLDTGELAITAPTGRQYRPRYSRLPSGLTSEQNAPAVKSRPAELPR